MGILQRELNTGNISLAVEGAAKVSGKIPYKKDFFKLKLILYSSKQDYDFIHYGNLFFSLNLES